MPEPTAGLVVYDLRTALHRLDEGQPVEAQGRGRSGVTPMRKLLVLAIIGGIVYWFLNRGAG